MLDMQLGESQAKWIAYKPQNDEWVYNDGEVSEKAMSAFIFDHENIKAGWGKVQAGAPPEYKWRANNNVPEPQPGEDYKKAMSVDLYFNTEHMQGVYSWTTNAYGPVQGIYDLYAEIYKEAANNPDKLAVAKYIGNETKKFTVGSTKIPQFEIIKWVDRPEDWSTETIAEPELVAEETTQDDIPF